jgi:ABC-type branched-subunit amino acid transport system permease subunit
MLATQGLEVTVTRLLVFCISAFFAGVGGALLIVQPGTASAVTFGPIQSLLFLVVLTICGTSSLRAPVIAALFLGVAPGYTTGFGFERQLLVFGACALAAATLLARRAELRAWVAQAAATSGWRRVRGPAMLPRPVATR